MPKPIDAISRSRNRTWKGHLRYVHWLVDNQVYFITARVRDGFPAFAQDDAKRVFWTKFEQYAEQFGFRPWVTSLLDNHYHCLGHLKLGGHLPRFIQRLHGSVAKLLNDLLPKRIERFWRDHAGKEYFDGCIRSEKQARLAFRYTILQSRRAGNHSDWRDYPHTRVNVDLDHAVARASELGAFLDGVPCKRFEDARRSPLR